MIATDAVGAAAGGLVQNERTGLVVRAGDADALRAAVHRLRDDPALRARLGANGRAAIAAYTPQRVGARHVPGLCGPSGRAASVNSPMRRTIFMALLAALLLAPAASADPIKILRDCNDDEVLQGSYTASELREARNEIPTDADEYSACRDVLSRAIADKAASSNNGGNGGGTSSRGGSSSLSDSLSRRRLGLRHARPPTPAPTATPDATVMPSTEADGNAVNEALTRPAPVVVSGKAVSPGESRLAASVGRNTVPTSLFVVFGLLVLAGLVALGAPLIRRRVVARKQT